MEKIALKANVRDGAGKSQAQKLRKQGLVPAIVYHRGEKSVPITVPEKEISRILRSSENENVLIDLSIEGSKKKSRAVLIKEVQHHPVKRNILHVDFNEISMTEKIQVEVGVTGVGEPIGVKQDGGILEHPLREVKVECLPGDIPGHIDVDISGLKIGDSIHVKDLKVSDKVKVLNDPETMLFQVVVHVEEKPEEAAAPQEVEVIREKKEEEPAKGAAPEKEEPKGEKK